MEISTYQLEEDEIKIDNLLNKVLHASKIIDELNKQIKSIPEADVFDKEFVMERAGKIDILINTIINIVSLADDIDVSDQSVTSDLEMQLKEKLGSAIEDIKDAYAFLNRKKD